MKSLVNASEVARLGVGGEVNRERRAFWGKPKRRARSILKKGSQVRTK